MLDIKSELSGTVWKVEVAVGDQVEEGQDLLILESMKMEVPVSAPEAGWITEILVQPNEAVQEGQVLLRLQMA